MAVINRKVFLLTALLCQMPSIAHATLVDSGGKESCPSRSEEWEKRYKSVAMERAPSMFDKCNPFSDIFVSDFWGDLLDKIGIPDFELCGYGKDEIFEDTIGKSENGIRESASSAIKGEIEDTINKAIKPVTGKGSTGSDIMNGGSNDAIKDIIFN
ncbi:MULTISPECIES: hypothetical protein [Aeromonas]|uniref:Uncharacterized protein n=1 Tax=Aeromonas veronii TaxID=654 RepID=A0A4V3YZQ7_AERVE|nr:MULTISPECIES: hypothetical protein [Aeromonas]THJ43702.1 hypothetical protein E8Q35_15470 [Aeromonas veronii]